MQLPKKHISILSSDAVRSICKELFNQTIITHFSYSRLYENMNVIFLTSDPDYHICFWENNYYKEFFSSYYKEGNRIPVNLSENLMEAVKIGEELNIYLPIMKIYARSKYLEGFGFATDSLGKNEILEYYLNNLHFLNIFEQYFMDKGAELIKQAVKTEERLCGTERKRKYLNKEKLSSMQDKNFFIPNSYMIYIAGQVKKITLREYTCLKYLAYGYTSKESADEQGISAKTIESYLRNIKNKLGLDTRKELTDVFHKNFNSTNII